MGHESLTLWPTEVWMVEAATRGRSRERRRGVMTQMTHT